MTIIGLQSTDDGVEFEFENKKGYISVDWDDLDVLYEYTMGIFDDKRVRSLLKRMNVSDCKERFGKTPSEIMDDDDLMYAITDVLFEARPSPKKSMPPNNVYHAIKAAIYDNLLHPRGEPELD